MQRLQLGNSGLVVSQLCYGVMPFGTGVTGQAMDRLYCAFREAGGNFFDTAHCYCFWIENGHGASERALGELIRRHGGRDDIVIATKGCHPAVPPHYPRPDRFISPQVLASDIDESLQRLGVDHIDLYYLHRDDPRMPVGEIVEILNAEVRRGRIRRLAASNWTVQRIAEANEYAAAHGLLGFDASQPQWSLAQLNQREGADPTMRFLGTDDVRWHERSGLPVVPYSPTACGYFATGGLKSAAAFENAVSRGRLERATVLARELGRSVNQIALAWLMSHPFAVFPIIGTKDPEHLADAISAADLRLTGEQCRWLWGA
jgi:aryl-alcohol dehydrogenase-like predicted oxidoreductase